MISSKLTLGHEGAFCHLDVFLLSSRPVLAMTSDDYIYINKCYFFTGWSLIYLGCMLSDETTSRTLAHARSNVIINSATCSTIH